MPTQETFPLIYTGNILIPVILGTWHDSGYITSMSKATNGKAESMTNEQMACTIARERDHAHSYNLAGMPTIASEIDTIINRIVDMLTDDRPDLRNTQQHIRK